MLSIPKRCFKEPAESHSAQLILNKYLGAYHSTLFRLVESYGYLAAHETNQIKDYKTAIEKLKKILEIDPENKDAQQYISTLEKKISSDKDTGSNR